MCGIGGLVRFDPPAEQARARLRSLMRALQHRGPDGHGELIEGPAAICHTRLALLDARHGQQPMLSPDGRWALVYNGELYNHRALRGELRWNFQTRSDAETVLAAWAQWGRDALPRFNGMFSFFIWDRVRQEGFAARDILGVKPFAYSFEGGELLFASEAKALLAAKAGPRRAHLPTVLEYLVAPYFSCVEHSPFDGIHYLSPGGLLRVSREGLAVERWGEWTLPSPELDSEPDEPDAVSALTQALLAAVPDSLQADVPVGLFLSGGLDSTAIAAIAATRTSWRGPTFTARFPEPFESSDSMMVISEDLPFARDAARTWNLELEEVEVTAEGSLKQLSISNDALPAWEQERTQRLLSQAAAKRVKAVLVGDAADETHYGYRFILDSEISPALLMRALGGFPLKDPTASDRILNHQLAGHDWSTPSARVRSMTDWVTRRWLPRLLHNGDCHSMAFGLEARVPFADSRVLKAAQRIGPAQALRAGVGKAGLRSALEGIVPGRWRTRVKSALPKNQATQSRYQSEAKSLLSEPPALVTALVELEGIRKLIAAPKLTEAQRAQLFRFIALSHWARHYEVQPS